MQILNRFETEIIRVRKLLRKSKIIVTNGKFTSRSNILAYIEINRVEKLKIKMK